jgi:beta-glucosidase
MYPGYYRKAMHSEGLAVGYRWYHTHKVTPAFAFGHGLSYTTFEFGKVNATDPQHIKLSIKNNGTCEGKEVVQLYISFPNGTDEPPKILKGFEKIHLDVN